ncbi:MAG: lamin tail domain-containing protein [Flavobacteriales bacterium]|nr:lamin tail domain-containing protein [Flavobacteriales bacterium]
MKHIYALSIASVLAGAAQAQVVINEVDYDQVGTDATEYVEIYNSGAFAFPLQYLQVVFINGNAGGAVEYRTLESVSWPALDPGDFFVICANAATPNCDHLATPATNLIQNGSPDAIALVMTQPVPTVIDVLSYGGSVLGYTEGTGTTIEDSNLTDGISIGRFPDGNDTQDNNSDFVLMCSSPGAGNVVDPQACDLSSGVATLSRSASFTAVPSPDGQGVLVFDPNRSGEPLSYELLTADGALVASSGSRGANASWYIDLSALKGRLLLVRLTTPTRNETRRIALP